MTTVNCPVVHFDHHSPEFADDPWPILENLREQGPIAWSEAYGGFWVVSGYDAIREVAHDDVTYSSADSILIPPKKNAAQRSLPIETDPPLFHEYRRLMQPLFSPAAVERLEPAIETFVRRSIDEFVEKGSCDFVHDLADPVPAMTTLHKLGLPVELWKAFAEPLHRTVFLRQDHPLRKDALEGLAAVHDILVEAIAARRHSPRDDMITYVVNGTVDGRPVTDEEALSMIQLTIQGGFDTTGSSIGSALIRLDEDRAARQWLQQDLDRIPTAVEEFLRYEAPQFALARTATRDCELAGQQVKKGDKILVVWASGNRDTRAFDDPDRLHLDRNPNRHMTFGLGAHRCLGSTMARRMIELTLRAVLKRLPDYEIDHEHVVKAETIGVVYGKFSVPARFTPGSRLS